MVGGTSTVTQINNGAAAATGTILYDTGAITIDFNAALPNNQDITATYFRGALSATDKQSFTDYMEEFRHVTTLVNIRDPIGVLVPIDVDVFHLDGFSPTSLQLEVQNALTTLFGKQIGAINRTYQISDILCAITDIDGVDYAVLNDPTASISLAIDEYAVLDPFPIINVSLTTRS